MQGLAYFSFYLQILKIGVIKYGAEKRQCSIAG